MHVSRLSMLTARSRSLEPRVGGIPTLRPSDVAAMLRGLPAPVIEYAFARYLDDPSARRRLAGHLLDVALDESWRDDPDRIITLIDLAIASCLDHGACPRCNGTRYHLQKPCGRCDGTGRWRPKTGQIITALGIGGYPAWYRTWRDRYAALVDMLGEWEGQLCRRLRRE